MEKASSSKSPLAKPELPIHKWAVQVQQDLYLPDPAPFYIVLGTVVANMMTGNPVWLMVVGPSGGGKGASLKSIKLLDKMKRIDQFEGVAGMMSGSSKKDKVKDATGGWLVKMGQRGMIYCEEFTSILSQSKDDLKRTMSVLRQLSGDGTFNRDIGTDGGVTIRWEGSVGFIGGSTSSIDEFTREIGEFGQRWVMFRYSDMDSAAGRAVGEKVLENKDPDRVRQTLAEITKDLFDRLSLKWSCYIRCEEKDKDQTHKCEPGPGRRDFTQEESRRIINLATWAARARSIVARNWRGQVTREVQFESPARITSSLGQLLLAFEILGLEEQESWKLIEKVAWDSIMPSSRIAVLKKLESKGEGRMTTRQVEDLTGMDHEPVRWLLGDLKVLGLIDWPRGTAEFRLTEWASEALGKIRR